MVSGSDLGLYWVEEGYMHSISLDSSGNVRCWGVNVEGQCGSEYGVDSGLYYWSPFPAMPPDFSINAPESEPAFSGGSAALPIEVVRLGGFNINGVGGGDPVSLTASGSTGVSVSLHPPVITPESPTSLMALNVLEGVASGVQTITVEGSSNGMVRTADVVVPISSPGSQEALTCLRGEWRTLTCGESKQQSLLFNADGRGFFENPDCNNICEAMVLNYHYTVSGNTFTLHYGTPDPVMCEGYGELPVSKPSQDDTLEFSCTDSRLSTTSSIGTEVYDKAVSQ